MDLNTDTSTFLQTGGGTVGTSAAQLTATSRKICHGVEIIPSSANADTIYVGSASTVTANGGDSTTGVPLPAAGKIFQIDDPSKLYLIASQSGQLYFYRWW